MKRNIKLNSVLPLLFLISSIAGADEGDYKHILKKNYQLVYDYPNYVKTIYDMFTDGMFYGRHR